MKISVVLQHSVLKIKKKIFLKNLEPVVVADLLFEEYNLPVIVHDKITETKYLRNQIRYLLKTLKEGTEDLFQGFLEILQRNEESQIICEQLGNLDTTSVAESMSSEKSSTQKHEIVREAGNESNFFSYLSLFYLLCINDNLRGLF